MVGLPQRSHDVFIKLVFKSSRIVGHRDSLEESEDFSQGNNITSLSEAKLSLCDLVNGRYLGGRYVVYFEQKLLKRSAVELSLFGGLKVAQILLILGQICAHQTDNVA